MDAQKRIRELMEERGWTDYRLALEAVCKAFGITLVQFFSEGNEIFTEEQQLLISSWSTLNDEQKRILLELMKAIERKHIIPLFFQ